MLDSSMSDDFNDVLANQIVNTLWLDADRETQDRQLQAALAPDRHQASRRDRGHAGGANGRDAQRRDGVFRRSMMREQTFRGRREGNYADEADPDLRDAGGGAEPLSRQGPAAR